jgi:hypothetical protein
MKKPEFEKSRGTLLLMSCELSFSFYKIFGSAQSYSLTLAVIEPILKKIFFCKIGCTKGFYIVCQGGLRIGADIRIIPFSHGGVCALMDKLY